MKISSFMSILDSSRNQFGLKMKMLSLTGTRNETCPFLLEETGTMSERRNELPGGKRCNRWKTKSMVASGSALALLSYLIFLDYIMFAVIVTGWYILLGRKRRSKRGP